MNQTHPLFHRILKTLFQKGTPFFKTMPWYIWGTAGTMLCFFGILLLLYFVRKTHNNNLSMHTHTLAQPARAQKLYSENTNQYIIVDDTSSFFDSPEETDQPSQKFSSSLYSLVNGSHFFDRGNLVNREIALTFDGGFGSNVATAILDTLQSRKVHATLFLTGSFIAQNSLLVNIMHTSGHEIGNHTNSHPHLTTYAKNRIQQTMRTITEKSIWHELNYADSSLFTLCGFHFAPYWRCPYGEINSQIAEYGKSAGYTAIGWGLGKNFDESFDTGDWIADTNHPGYRSPKQILNKFVRLAQQSPHGLSGGIILMHMNATRTNPEAQIHRVLGTLIDTLSNMGYKFVTISKLIENSSSAIAASAQNEEKGPLHEF